MATLLPKQFSELLSSCSLEVKRAMLAALTDNITSSECAEKSHNPNAEESTLVEHVSDIGISKDLSETIESELNTMNIHSGNKLKVKTVWLSLDKRSYNYGNVINKPQSINNYPGIKMLMGIVNKHPNTTQDADVALVSCFPSNEACLSHHSDDEPLISQSSSISTVSFGGPRVLMFAKKVATQEEKSQKVDGKEKSKLVLKVKFHFLLPITQ